VLFWKQKGGGTSASIEAPKAPRGVGCSRVPRIFFGAQNR